MSNSSRKLSWFGEKPGFQALSKGRIVLLCAEVVRQRVPDHGAVHSYQNTEVQFKKNKFTVSSVATFGGTLSSSYTAACTVSSHSRHEIRSPLHHGHWSYDDGSPSNLHEELLYYHGRRRRLPVKPRYHRINNSTSYHAYHANAVTRLPLSVRHPHRLVPNNNKWSE